MNIELEFYLFKDKDSDNKVFGYMSFDRIKEEIPEGLYKYQIRHDDEGKGDPVTLEKHVLVNHWGDFITNKEIKFPEDQDFINIDDNSLQYLLSGRGIDNINMISSDILNNDINSYVLKELSIKLNELKIPGIYNGDSYTFKYNDTDFKITINKD